MIPETRSTVVSICNRSVLLELPADPDQLLQDAVDAEAAGIRHADAYWGLLWDAAPKTAELILSRSWTSGLQALELGCGAGLAGIAGLMAGMQVTFSDLVPSAVQLAQHTAALNGFADTAGLVIDWCDPPDHTFDLLLASDVMYDSANHLPLLKTLQAMLADNGLVWIGDAGRANSPKFIQLARVAGWQIDLYDQKCSPLSTPSHVQYQLLVMRRQGRSSW